MKKINRSCAAATPLPRKNFKELIKSEIIKMGYIDHKTKYSIRTV
jgi:hypothetical protein